jgi:formate/nitrite transporter FocA (FNT family)
LEVLIAMPVDKQRVHEKKQDEIIDRTSPPGEVIYEAVYAEGEHELERNSLELAFSGLAAGLSMGLSMVTEGLLQHHLPNSSWQPLIAKLGYSIGFVVVILGRQQLFTKNTLTVILPLLRQKEPHTAINVARLWLIVLLGNLVGAFVFAWLVGSSNIFSSEVRDAFSKIGQVSMQPDFWTIVVRGALAGWLIALMVWLLPFAESARLWVVIILAYVVGIAELPHVVAGAVESFYLVTTGAVGFWHSIGSYVLPAFIGNVIGGAALVAFGAHAEFFEAEEVAE